MIIYELPTFSIQRSSKMLFCTIIEIKSKLKTFLCLKFATQVNAFVKPFWIDFFIIRIGNFISFTNFCIVVLVELSKNEHKHHKPASLLCMYKYDIAC